MAGVPVALQEDIYGGGPRNDLLRYWLSVEITREAAEQSLSTPTLAPVADWQLGSFIVRRSTSSRGDYAITVVEPVGIKSYKVNDLGCGQVGVQTGDAYASLEHLLEFFYDHPFPTAGGVPLHIMHQYLATGAQSGFQQPPQFQQPPPQFQQPPPQNFQQQFGVPVQQGFGGRPPVAHPGADLTYGDYDEAGHEPQPVATDEGTYGTAEDSIPFDRPAQVPGTTYGDMTYGDGDLQTYGDNTYGG